MSLVVIFRWLAGWFLRLALLVEPSDAPRLRAQRIASRLLASVRRCQSFEGLTDRQLGSIILYELWGRSTAFSRDSDVLSEVIDRLHRANGGPVSREEQDRIWDEIEAEENDGGD